MFFSHFEGTRGEKKLHQSDHPVTYILLQKCTLLKGTIKIRNILTILMLAMSRVDRGTAELSTW